MGVDRLSKNFNEMELQQPETVPDREMECREVRIYHIGSAQTAENGTHRSAAVRKSNRL